MNPVKFSMLVGLICGRCCIIMGEETLSEVYSIVNSIVNEITDDIKNSLNIAEERVAILEARLSERNLTANVTMLMEGFINNQKITAIKAHRQLTAFGLKESKDEVERFYAMQDKLNNAASDPKMTERN